MGLKSNNDLYVKENLIKNNITICNLSFFIMRRCVFFIMELSANPFKAILLKRYFKNTVLL